MGTAKGFINIWKRIKAWSQRCRTCDADGIDGSFVDQFPDLKPVEPLKFGHLYQCSRCGCYWFLHEHKRWLSRIHDDSLVLVHRWNESRLTVEASVLNVLASIGGVENFNKDHFAVPCAIQNVSGQQHEKAIVLISKQPPFGWPEAHLVHWADELVVVAPSSFALPLSVRQASSEKREEAMGFAPVGVVDKKGIEYTLGCESRFFDYNGTRGEEMRLSGLQKKWRNIVWPKAAQAFYFVDWSDQCDKLLVPRSRA